MALARKTTVTGHLLCCFASALLVLAGAVQVSAFLAPSQDDPPSRAVVQLLAVGPAEQGQNRECSATGFLIDEQGYLITSAHVVEAAKRCLQNTRGAKILARLTVNDAYTASAVPCDVVGVDAPHDLALLKTERPLLAHAGDGPPYAALDTRPAASGAEVKVTGYPARTWLPITQSGRVVWTGQTTMEANDGLQPSRSDALMMDIQLRSGNSGSPVYRRGGGVIAVVDKRDSLRPAYSIAVSIRYAIALANRYGARWHSAS